MAKPKIVFFESVDGLLCREIDGWNHEVYMPWRGGWQDADDINFATDVWEISEDEATKLMKAADALGKQPPAEAEESEPVEESFAGRVVLVVGDGPDEAGALLEGATRATRMDPPDVVIARGSSIRKRARAAGIEARSWNDVRADALRGAEIRQMDPAQFAIWSRQLPAPA